MTEKLLELGSGLELWRIEIKELKEQDLNARSMKTEMFSRLTANIRDDQRLESFPFIAQTERGFEIVSGHHRVRAAIDAGLTEIYCIVDVTNLNRDAIASKQLAHNAISGEDNDELIKRIFNSIADAEQKLKTFININFEKEVQSASAREITFDERYRIITLLFSQYDADILNKALDEMAVSDDVYINELRLFEDVKKAIKVGQKSFNIRSTNTLMMYLMESVYAKLDMAAEDFDDVEHYDSLAAILGFGMIPEEHTKAIKERFSKLASKYKKHEKYYALLDLLNIEHGGETK